MNENNKTEFLVFLNKLGLDIDFSKRRSSAATPSFLTFVAKIILDDKPETIVELGSGLSTAVIAACLKKNGHGKLFSFDHSAYYASQTKGHLRRNQLEAWATICTAPLCEHLINADEWKWYDFRSHLIETERINLLIVDGPPGKIGQLARYPALLFLYGQLTDGAKIVLDDAKRSDERKIIARWKCEFHLNGEFIRHQRGTYLFHVEK
jgi:hypothetical protein